MIFPARILTRVLLALTFIPFAHGEPPLTGSLTEVEQFRVLHLWGDREQAGYTHGYLMAPEIVDLVDSYVLDESIVPNPQTYETMLIANVERMFTWDEAARSELKAMLRGARERMGDRFRSEKLDRTLELRDLMVINVIADWFGFLCSSLSVWGELSTDGTLRTGRNLDFPYTTSMAKGQLILFYEADETRWAGVSWPGLIGVYTGFSEHGVTMLMHDANGLPAARSAGFVPRSLSLREALVRARPGSFLEDVAKVFRAHPVMVGNNIHVSGPGQPPAGIFEYDGSGTDKGVTLRLPKSNAPQLQTALWCTNHMRARRKAEENWRYPRLTRKVQHAATYDEPIDLERMFVLMKEVEQRMTLHTVVFEPLNGVMHVRIPARQEGRVTFKLADHWRKTEDRKGK